MGDFASPFNRSCCHPVHLTDNHILLKMSWWEARYSQNHIIWYFAFICRNKSLLVYLMASFMTVLNCWKRQMQKRQTKGNCTQQANYEHKISKIANFVSSLIPDSSQLSKCSKPCKLQKYRTKICSLFLIHSEFKISLINGHYSKCQRWHYFRG